MKLSVITVNLNNAQGLQRTIESVLNQTFFDLEYIVIDGGSTDESIEVIKKYINKITYWISEPDDGIYNAMNKGILKANGEYLNFLNSGDIYNNSDVLKEVFCDKRDSVILYGDVLIEEENRIITYPDDLSMGFLYEQTIVQQATFYKRDVFAKFSFNEMYRIISDWAFLIDRIIFDECSYKHVGVVVVRYDPYGMSSDSANLIQLQNERQHFLHFRFPKMVLDDFQSHFLIRKSTLYESVFFLQKTVGLRTFTGYVVELIIWIYRGVRKVI